MAFYDKFSELCAQRGVSPSSVAKAIGLTTANPTYWKRGSIPKGDTLQKLADYFGVSVDYLLGSEKKKEDNPFWAVNLNDKLKCVGCSLEFAEVHEEYIEWLEFPDGILEVTDAELKELDQSTDSYLRFKLQELRERHPNDFRPKRKRQPPQEAGESTPASQEGKDTTPPPDAPETPPEGK